MGPGAQSKHKLAVASMSLFFYKFNGRVPNWNRHTLGKFNSGSVTAIGMRQIAKNLLTRRFLKLPSRKHLNNMLNILIVIVL